MMTTTAIIVLFGDKPIGAIQSLTTIKAAATSEDGYPSYTLKSFRMRLDKTKIAEIFSREYVHVAAQKYPVQIAMIVDKKEVQRIHNVWFTSVGYTYTSGDWAIVEESVLEAEKITDHNIKSSDEHEDVEDEQTQDWYRCSCWRHPNLLVMGVESS